MGKSENKILVIDISSNTVKVGLISDDLKLDSTATQRFSIINEDLDGFAKRFEMEDLWDKVTICIKDILKKKQT